MAAFLIVMIALFSCSSPVVFRPDLVSITQIRNVAKEEPTANSLKDEPQYEKASLFDRFLRGMLDEKQRSELEESCRKSPTENLFCFSIINREYFEKKKESIEEKHSSSVIQRRRLKPRFNKKTVKNWLDLRTAPVSSTLASVALLNEERMEILKILALQEEKCPNNVAISLAAAYEDKLPATTAIVKDIGSLYQLGSQCILSNVSDRVTMLTRSGLFHFLAKDYQSAKVVLKESAATPNSFTARSLYWLYRTHKELKENTEADMALEELKQSYPFSFHTLMAITSREQDPGDVLLRHSMGQVRRSQQMPMINPLIEQVEILHRLGFEKSAGIVLDWAVAESQGVEPELKIYLAELKKEQGDYFTKISLLTEVLYQHPSLVSKETMELYFPRVFFPIFEKQASVVDPYLLLSIARRESAFNVKAVSSADARGLLQILPKLKNQLQKDKNLFNPEDNVELGARYLLKLLETVDGQIHLALAAYNAGPNRLKVWMERYPMDNPILFVDLIPYRETREYIASVLRNYYWYRRIHLEKPEISPRQLIEIAVTKGG